MRAIKERIEANKAYPIIEAIELLKSQQPDVKFPQSVELHINTNVDTRKNQNIRNAILLPHGTGRTVRVAVLARGEQAEASKEAGATQVGYEDLIEQIKGGMLDFDVLIAEPSAMPLVGQLGPILGPRGLMPNPKLGTVTPQPATAVHDAMAGRVQYRTDKGGVIHCLIGKLSFGVDQLKENLQVLLAAIIRDKPEEASKGSAFIKKITLSSTMGPGLKIDQSSLDTSISI